MGLISRVSSRTYRPSLCTMGFLYTHQHPNGSIEIQFNEKLKPEIFNPLFNKFGFKLLSCLTKVILQPKLSGGKGAFRQLMRNVGRTTTKSNNQSMARDLNGRRIRDVENEKRLQDWCDGEGERRVEREEDRKKRLEKMAKRATDEQQRKTYLDANFDEESQVMMDMMDNAVSASMVMTEELNTTVETLNKTIKQLKRPASYNEGKKLAKKSKKMSFGFDEDDFSSSEEEDEDTLRLKAIGTIVGRKLSDTQRRASNELADTNEEMLRLKAMSSMVERQEEELLRLQAIGSCLENEKMQVTIENTGASSSSDCEKSFGTEAQQIPVEKAQPDEIIEIKEQEIPDEKPKQQPLPEPLPASEQRPMSEQCGTSAASHVNAQIANPSLENTGSLVIIPPEEKTRKLAKHCPKNPPAKDVIVIDDDAEGGLVDLTRRKDKDKRIFGLEMTYMNPKDTQGDRPSSYPPIAMKWVTSIIELRKYGRYHLQHELKRRGVKSGGTVDQQAERLFSIKGLSKKQIPVKLRMKVEPTKPPQIPVQLGGLAQIQKEEKVVKAKKLTFEYGKLQEELGNVQFRKRYSGN